MKSKINISLSAGPAKRPVSKDDVKTAKSILKTASRQEAKENRNTYKEVDKELGRLRKRKSKEIDKLSRKIDILQSKLDSTTSRYDSQLEKLTARRDAVATKSGIITSLESPRAAPVSANPSHTKIDKEDKPHNVKLPSRSKKKEKPEEEDSGDDRDSTPKVPPLVVDKNTKVKPASKAK